MSRYKRYERYKDSGVEWIGEIPEHWNNKKISWIFNIIGSGTTPSTSNLEYYDGDVPWVNTGDLNDGYLYETSKMITDLALKDYSTLKFYPIDTLLIAMYGATIGKLSITKIIATTNQACCALAQPKNVNIKFIFYWFLANRNHIIAMAYGGGQPNISQNLIKSLRINLPEKHEQNAIVNFLDQKTAVIDDLIADKEKLIELLQEKRQAIITEAVTKGLNLNVKMKDSGIEWIGEIPEHWRIVRLKFLKTSPFQYGANEPAEMDDPQLPRYIRITDINEKGDLREDTFKSLSWESAQPYLLKDGDILFARSGATVGKIFMYRGELGPACYAGYLIRFKPDKSKVNSYYIYYYTLSKVYEEWIKQNIIQATIQNVSAEKYGNLQVPLPPLEEQKGIVKYLNDKIEEIDILVESIYVQIQKLKEYRQSLISEAVTGKIDVRDYVVSN